MAHDNCSKTGIAEGLIAGFPVIIMRVQTGGGGHT